MQAYRQTPVFTPLLKSSLSYKKAIPYSLALRLRRICSKDEFFEHRSAELLSYLTKRGYKDCFVKEQILRAKQIPRNETLQEHNHDKDKSNTPVPF